MTAKQTNTDDPAALQKEISSLKHERDELRELLAARCRDLDEAKRELRDADLLNEQVKRTILAVGQILANLGSFFRVSIVVDATERKGGGG